MIQIDIFLLSLKCWNDFQGVNKTSITSGNKPPCKKQRPVSPHDIEPPKMFKDTLGIMVALLKMTYQKLKSPLELITFFPIEEKPPLLLAKHNVTTEEHNSVYYIELVTGQVIKTLPIYYELTGSSMLSSKTSSGLKTTLRQLRNKPTTERKHLLAAFCASHPQISLLCQEPMIALG
jgi:hypothetical protein